MVILFSMSMNPVLSSADNINDNCRYAKTTVNIRASPSMKSKIIGCFYWNDKVQFIKKANRKWSQVRYKGKKRYVYTQYLKKNKSEYRIFYSPSIKTFKSYEDANCITDNPSVAQGRLKKKYHLDYRSGVWMVGNRYCIAIGSYYTKSIGVKIDLVLSHNGRKRILKCITADSKADKDTVNNHKIHKDGSVVEFIVKTNRLHEKALRMGDVSYTNKKFRGKIEQIRIYK